MNLKKAIKIMCAVMGSLFFIHFFDSLIVNVSGMEFIINLKLSWKGYTSIVLPPLGVLKATTHKAPVQINIVLQNINLDFIKSILDVAPNKRELILMFKNQINHTLYILAAKTVLLGLLGAAFGGIVLRLKNKEVVLCSVIGLLITILLLTSVFATYNMDAFNTPEYSGTLKAAPWIINLLNKGISQINELGQQLKNMSDNISTVFSKMDGIGPIDGNDEVIRVLHVSDIHNNPAAYDFMEQVVKNFKVDFIIDTGDITDYGTPLENMIIKNLAKLSVKYIYVSGNHDSQSVINMLKKAKNVAVLDGKMINIDGINVLGFSDPASKTGDIEPPDEMKIMEQNLKIHEWLDISHSEPDILAVHNPKITENIIGRVPVILNGHTHKLNLFQRDGSIVINAGTTGAAGIRGFQTNSDIPYSAVLLYFKKPGNNQKTGLMAADVIKISNLKTGFQVERVFFNRGGRTP
jgi:putative phosphoesterase